MTTFKCHRCKRALPERARAMSQVDFCVDCKESDLKQASPYFRDGRWKQLPKYLNEMGDGSLRER